MSVVEGARSLIPGAYRRFLLLSCSRPAVARPPDFPDELVPGGPNPVNLATLPVLLKQSETRISRPQQLPAASSSYMKLAGPRLDSGGERGSASLTLEPNFSEAYRSTLRKTARVGPWP